MAREKSIASRVLFCLCRCESIEEYYQLEVANKVRLLRLAE